MAKHVKIGNEYTSYKKEIYLNGKKLNIEYSKDKITIDSFYAYAQTRGSVRISTLPTL